MNRKIFFLATLLLTLGAETYCEIPSNFLAEESQEIIVHNRILAKANGKSISVVDVMKKMDLLLQQYYPHLTESKAARFQFYTSQWQDTLSQMVDQELILTDAERIEVKVTDAEVREEVLQRFGPNVMGTLDKIGITYEEARQILHDELIVQKMMWFRVNSKALFKITPKDIREAYMEHCRLNPALTKWKYQVLSIRSPQAEIGKKLAARAFDLMKGATDLAATAKEIGQVEDESAVQVSAELEVDQKSISASHRKVLETLTPGAFSDPIGQTSRSDNSTVYRIFHLKEIVKQEVPTFDSLSERLKDLSLKQEADKENKRYLLKLRERLGYDEKQMLETLPDDFHPFSLR